MAEDFRKRLQEIRDARMASLSIKHTPPRERVEGFREQFLSLITDKHMSIRDAIAKFLEEHKAYDEGILLNWLREAVIKGGLSKEVLEEVKLYLEDVEQEKIKENDNDGR